MQRSFIWNKNGRSHYISKWLVATGLGAENWRARSLQNTFINNWWKNQERVYRGRTNSGYTYILEEIKYLGKRFVQSSSWAQWNSVPVSFHCTLKNCQDSVVSEKQQRGQHKHPSVIREGIMHARNEFNVHEKGVVSTTVIRRAASVSTNCDLSVFVLWHYLHTALYLVAVSPKINLFSSIKS